MPNACYILLFGFSFEPSRYKIALSDGNSLIIFSLENLAMRKRIISPQRKTTETPAGDWLDLENLCEVEITSENPDYPIEAALMPGQSHGWRAAVPGKQTIRLVFARPLQIGRVWLSFVETGSARTQQYTLRWSPDNGHSFKEIVRQQWNFSPDGATVEQENHFVELSDATMLELTIIPDISGGDAVASLMQLRLA